jgi:hypothetical protein
MNVPINVPSAPAKPRTLFVLLLTTKRFPVDPSPNPPGFDSPPNPLVTKVPSDIPESEYRKTLFVPGLLMSSDDP